VLVDPEDEDAFGEVVLQSGQPFFAQIGEAGVVGASFGVVVVGDESHVETESTEEVETFHPAGLFTDLVDLVDGHGHGAQGQRRR
jgi:hypothetical protein